MTGEAHEQTEIRRIAMEMPYQLEVLWCRTFQSVLKIGNYFMGYRMPKCMEGPGKIRELGAFLKEKKDDHVLVVTDRTLMNLGLPENMLKSMDEQGIHYVCFSDIGPNPTSDDVEKGFEIYRQNSCKTVVAFGGGSPMDCAKAICAKAAHPNRKVSQMQGILRVLKPVPHLYAVPTTAGTGSETTVAAVITDSKTHRKAAINDPFLIPKYAVLDPELTVGLPPYTTATTGMDALAHAVEAYTNRTYNTGLENRLAREAVRLIHDNILTAVEDGTDPEARQNMQRAAFYAGRAFTRGCVGYVHAIGHTLGSLYGVAHGLAMAVLLPYVMRQFGSAAHKRLAELADVCGIHGASDAEKAEAFLCWIEQTNARMGLPDSFHMIRDEDVDQMISWAKKEANPLYPVPVIWGAADFRDLIASVRKQAGPQDVQFAGISSK